VEFRLLGPLEVRAGEAPLPFGGGKQRALLAALLLRANRVVARERLIDELWGEKPPPTVVKLVQLYVSQLRKLLPEGTIVTRPPGYLLEVEPDAVDVLRFERLVAEARATSPERAAALLREALELWRGPALAEFAEESFFRTESERLEEQRLAALEARIDAELALGLHSDLVGELEALVAEQPHRERQRAQLMLALYRSGRQAEALAAYRDARATLDELGLEPGAGLRELEQQILNQAPALDLAPAPVLPVGTVTTVFTDVEGSTALLGRLGTERYREQLELHRRLVRAAFARHGGREVEVLGDGFHYAFARASDAVEASAEAQQALRETVWPHGEPMAVRIGVHTGQPETAGGLYVGLDIHRAARIAASAHGSQVLLSSTTAALVRDELPDTLSLLDLGEYRLKDLPEPERLYQLGEGEFPPLEAPRPGAGRRLLPSGEVQMPGPLTSTPAFPFVGRADELATLSSLLARADGGEGGIALIAGEAGGGKTRLVREFAHQAAAAGVLVLYGSSDAAVTIPYQPLREWLEFLLRSCDPDALRECLGTGGRELARLVPELATLTGAPASQARDADNERFALQAAAGELLAHLGREQPLLLALDDLHWADAETLHLIRRFARSAPRMRWLIVAAYRAEDAGGDVAGTIADLSRLDATTRLVLPNLSGSEVEAFIRASADAEPTAELAATIGELTDGTPLLLCELWRELCDRGEFEVTQSVRLRTAAAELRGPERLADIMRQRLARLAPETAAFVELAAVAGARFELRVVADAAALGQSAFVAAVEEAAGSGIVEELPDAAASCRFSHELVRRAVYDRLKRIRRAELHLRVGEALERVHAADLSQVLPELAHHFTLGAPVSGAERAVDYNLRAAAAATEAAALGEAAARLSTALELGIVDEHERVRVQVELAWLLAESGRVVQALALFDDALVVADRLGQRALAAEVRVLLGWRDWLGSTHGSVEEKLRTATDAITTFAELGDARGLALARHLLGYAYRGMGRCADACTELELALVDATASRHAPTRTRVISQLVQMLCLGPATADETIRRCEELRSSCRGEALLAATIERLLSFPYAMAGRAEEARACDDHASEILNDVDYHTQVYSRFYAGQARWLLGDVEAAEEHLLAVWRRFGGETDAPPTVQANAAVRELVLLYCGQDRWDDAERWLAQGDETVFASQEGNRILPPRGRVAHARALVASHRRESDKAMTLALRALDALEESDYLNWRAGAWLALAEILRANGEDAEADAAAARALDLYERKGNVIEAERLRAIRPAAATPGTA